MAALRIAIGQINTRVGDFSGNVRKVQSCIERGERAGADLMLFPEMCVCGHPVKDLAFSGSFMKASREAMQRIAGSTKGSSAVVVAGGMEEDVVSFNAAAIMQGGQLLGWTRKRRLFCCADFDETRYFSAGQRPLVIESDRFRAAVTIGEDFAYPVFPAEVEMLINLWNEPYHFGHRPVREQMMVERAKEDAVAIVMVSPVGGQDDMVFEGSSCVVDGFGELLARGGAFSEDLLLADLDLDELKAYRERVLHSSQSDPSHLQKARRLAVRTDLAADKKSRSKRHVKPLLKGPEELFTALVLATRDFVQKNGLKKAVVGVSGGVDSALTVVIARRALGKSRVMAISMPGPYTSSSTRKDAKLMARNLGVEFIEAPISNSFRSMKNTLAPAFKGASPDVTEENMQARIRGLTLMAVANKSRAVVLAPGNKSEAAAGYCTLYGDTAGGFAPLSDVYKTQVYELARWYNENAGEERIPESILTRAPSAELAADQVDQDVLPPYPVLDHILYGLLERGLSMDELLAKGEEQATLEKVISMLMHAQFKRRQSPMGPTVSERPLSELRLPVSKTIGWWAPATGPGKKESEKKSSKKSAAGKKKTAERQRRGTKQE